MNINQRLKMMYKWQVLARWAATTLMALTLTGCACIKEVGPSAAGYTLGANWDAFAVADMVIQTATSAGKCK